MAFTPRRLMRGASGAGSQYQISRSLRFNSADSAYLNRTPATATNRRTYTFSAWVKRSKGTDFKTIFSAATDTSNLTIIRFKDDEKIEVRAATGGITVFQLVTTQVFRDFSAWYHFVLAVDTTNATGGDRVRLYVNGSEVTTFDTDTIPTQNADSWVNNNILHEIGRQANNASNYYQDGYMTEMYLIDGTQLTPSSFGETNAQTGVWQPKRYSGSYGTNGFYLNFSDNSNTTAATLGKDYSGNGNNWTPNNFSVTAGAGNDSLVDSPTSYGVDTGVGGTVRGNYCTLNPLDFANGTLSNGNLDWSATSGTGLGCFSTFAFDIADSTNQYYWEFTLNSGEAVFGIVPTTTLPSNTSRTGSYGYYNNGNKYSGVTGSAYGTAFTSAIIGVAVGSGTITFYRNGVSQGAAFTGLTGIFKPAIWEVVCTATANFGQRAFAYTAPSGFKALCTQNLPTPTIGATTATQAGKFFNPVIYTGTGTNPRTITGVGFQPDWVWGKSRSTVNNNLLFDVVRGVSSTSALGLLTDTTGAEANYYTLNGGVTAFTSDGFTVSGGSTNNNLNSSGVTYVAWNWKANGAGVTNTAGSITSTVSANTTSGFSIVTYTGNNTNSTIGHGLGVAPKMIIVKSRSAVEVWPVYHASLTSAAYILRLNTTAAEGNVPSTWNSTSPTSTVFSVGNSAGVNLSPDNYVAYCFAEVAGYSKFGSYTGNGSADGPFVYTGFRPAFVLIKFATGTTNWLILDDKRDTYNVERNKLYPNVSDAEDTNAENAIDFVSNGFKIRTGNNKTNDPGATMIYAAFASTPLKFSLAR